MYAWAHNAPMLNLPKNVGFEVGGDSNINYLVLQVHYHRLFNSMYKIFGSHLMDILTNCLFKC